VRLCVGWGPRSPFPKRGEPPKFSAHVYCGQRAGWIKMVVGTEVGLSPGDFMLDGDSAPSPKGPQPTPQFSAHIYCGQTAGWIKIALGMEVGLSPGDFVLDEDPAPSPKRGRSPQFSAHVYCGQTAAWIKMPLGTEVGLGPDDIVLDGDPAPISPKRGRSALPNFRPTSVVAKRLDGSIWQSPPNFRPISIVAKRLMHQDATWYGGRHRPRPHCAR